MVKCAVPGCKNDSRKQNKRNSNISFHRFPKSREIIDAWVNAIKRPNWEPNMRSFVCSIHFNSSFISETKKGLRKLVQDAIPELYIKELDKINTHVSEDEEMHSADENEDTTEELTNAEDSDSELKKKKSRFDIEIDYDNIEKFGEQIVFLLKRIPRKLCREIQDSIVTLVKTVTNDYESKTKRDAPSCSKQSKTPKSQPIFPTFGRYTKHKRSELATPKDIIDPINTKPDVIMKEKMLEPIKQITQERLEKSPEQPTFRIKTFPKPMTVPIELVGSMDCVKQEVIDPEETSNTTHEEKNTEINYPIKTDIKVEIEDVDFVEEANRRVDNET